MAASNGLSDASPDLTGLTRALAQALRIIRLGRRGLHFAVQVLTAALMAVCGAPAHAQTPAVGDRYSGEVYSPPYSPPPYRPATGVSGPTLSWPGKTIAADTAQVAPATAADAYEPLGRPARQARVYGAAPVRAWYQRYDAGAPLSGPVSASGPSPLPTGQPHSIYDPPADARSPETAPSPAATGGETARFYSLHRSYGLTPDPDPIAPAAYTQTADLSVPPGASPADRAVSSAAVAPLAVQAGGAPSTPGQP